ncbi:hypothetical protein IPV69_01140 [Humisphaera borealis]|uniref:Choice-of-anchor D domain-containing protein n=1 Tax=Humisphaera borealis TaxID=2807512 RepID=A0A7M2WWU6_9BACT|nr:hypothetical protein IPV69_01140 [Humisphaera borealis]
MGGANGPSVSLSLKNTGTFAVKITGAALSGTNASQFAIVTKPGGGVLPYTVSASLSTSMSLAFKPPAGSTSTIRTATLTLTTNDLTKPTITVSLRGLATAGIGGQLEPSLQRIFDLYSINSRTGDSNPATTNLFSNTEVRGVNDEVTMQLLKKSGTAAVTIEPLAAFAGGSPAGIVGWYKSGTPGTKNKLLSVNGTSSQSVNVGYTGVTSFDPGTASFGLYSQYTNINTTQYSQDSLNTVETTIKRKIRFFPLKQNGVLVANAYIFTTEDWNNDRTGGTDSNDFVGIIRNVKLG